MFSTEHALENALSEPTPAVIDSLSRLSGDLVVLGAGGKMGPSLTRMAKRAVGASRRVIAVSRFSADSDRALREQGIDTVRCDLLNESEVMNLPDAENVVYMPARKFGSSGDEAFTWAINCYLPTLVCKKYRRAKIVAFSTGNVYPLVPIRSGGCREENAPNPVGEYGMSALGRERIFDYFARTRGIPVSIIRLNYACDLRYGVLVDLAQKVFHEQPVDLTMGHFNTIWQGDANAQTLRAFDFTAVPPRVFNVTGPETLSVRDVCTRFGELLKKTPHFTGSEADTALLSNAQHSIQQLGPLTVPTEQLIAWVANWVQHGGRLLNKPTHFETRDGRF